MQLKFRDMNGVWLINVYLSGNHLVLEYVKENNYLTLGHFVTIYFNSQEETRNQTIILFLQQANSVLFFS